MKIKQYDTVLLKNGKEAVIVEILNEDTFIADIGDSPKDWETIIVKLDEIKEVLNERRQH